MKLEFISRLVKEVYKIMGFLHQDTSITRLLSRLVDLILLNILWLICCLPVITIGASTTAMYDVLIKFAFHEDIPVIQTFFKKFIHHFKKSTIIYLISVFGILFLVFDFWWSLQWNINFKFLFQVVILSVGYFFIALVSYVFPTLAYFDKNIFKTIKHAFVLAMKSGIYTVFIMLMNLLPLILFLFFPNVFFDIIFLWFTFGFAFLAYLNSMHFARIFDVVRFNNLQKELRNKNKNSD